MSTTYRSLTPLAPAPAFRQVGWEMAFWGAVLAVTLTRVVAGFVRPGAFGAEPTVALLVSAGLVFLIGKDLAALRQSRSQQD